MDGNTCVVVCPVNTFPDIDRNCQLCNGTCLEFSQSLYEISVMENLRPAAALLTLSISDRRTISRPVEYIIVSGNDELYFMLNSSSGQLFIVRETDREQMSSFRLQVQVIDVGTNPISPETALTSIIVTIDDVNDSPPVFLSLPYTATVLENSPQGTTIISVSTIDNDIGTNAIVGYTIVSGNEGEYFMINQLSGIITTTNLEIDYENFRNFTLTVNAIDGGVDPLTSSAVVNIEVIDANDIRPVFTQAVYQSVLSESSIIGTFVTQLFAVDGDTAEDNVVIQYHLLDGLDTFIIDNFTGLIRTSTLLDRETITVYNLTVVVSDGIPNNEPLGTSTVEVFITDVNDNAPQFNSSVITTTINEDISVGQIVLEFSAIDSDLGNNSILTYAVINDTMLPFIITDDGVLITDDLLDRETVAAYTFTVMAVDRGDPPMTGSASVTITLSDVNDNEPVFMDDIIELEYAEDLSVDSIIAAVVAMDNDIGLNSQLTYSIISGNEEMRFYIDVLNGEIALNNSLDFETTQVYSLQIVAQDSGVPALSATATVMINITDINDNSPVFNEPQYNVTFLEITTINSIIFTANAIDADASTTNAYISYSIVTGNSDNTFSIDSATGVISLIRPLNFESTQSYLLTLAAANHLSDNPLQGTTQLAIFVADVNEFIPRFSQPVYEATVLENEPAATSVFQAVANDSDAGSSGELEYQIFSGNSAGNFEISTSSGLIVTTRPIDREDLDMFSLQILVSDGGTPSFSALASVSVTVLDVNDNPPVFSSSNYSAVVVENSPTGVSVSVFPMLRTTDIDMDGPNSQVTYSIVGTFPFLIAPQTGEISVSDDIDFENNSSYDVTILSVDGGFPSLSSMTLISITVVNLNDNAPVIHSSPTSVMFVEETVSGVLIIPDVVVIDVDGLPLSLMTISLIDLNGNPITFPDILTITTTPTVQLMNSNGGKVLQISGSFTTSDATTMLRTLTFINTENEPDPMSRFIRITVSDGTFVSTAVQVRIDIELINDNAPILFLDGQSSVYNVSFIEGSSPVHITGDVTIEDADSSPIISALVTIMDLVDGSSEGFMLLNNFPDELSVENNVSSLQMQGSAFASVYDVALENVVYFNTAEEPGTPLRRTINFTITDDQFNSETATTIIEIVLTNDPPRLDLGGNIDYETTFVEGTESVRLSSSSFTLFDNDNTSLYSAVVSLVNPLDGIGEALLVGLNEIDNSTVSVIQQPHQIIVMGLANVNVYSGIISSIQYSNTLANPSSDRRMVEFTVNDGILNSTTATAIVSFTLVNNPPIVDLNGPELGGNFTTTFQEDGDAVSITSENIIIRDIDSPVIAFAIIQLHNPVDMGQEGLTLGSVMNDVDVLFLADNSSIIISGEATSLVYSMVFQQLLYYNTAEQPTVEERLISFLVNDRSANSSLVFTIITVNQVDDVPMLIISIDPVFMTEYIEEGLAVRVVDLFAISITDGDNITLDNLILVVNGLLDGNNEVIEFSDPSSDGSLTVQQSNLPDNSRRYIFRFSESSQTITNFELLLQTLRYTNTLLEPTVGFRSLQFTISDGSTESIPVYSNLSVVLINDNSPEFDSLIYSTSVMENSVGVIVIALTATDSDASTGQFASHGIIEYSITSGNQDGLFTIDTQTGDIVIEVASDRESETGTFGGLLIVEARNPGSSQQDFANVLVTITDINDNAPQFVNFTNRFTISELAQSDSIVGLVSAQDIDAGSNAEIRYTLSQTTSIPFFAIDRFTGQISVTSTAQLDYELQPQYVITVTATDRGRPALANSTLVVIDLFDENDNAPMFEQVSYATSISESAQPDDEVLTVRAVDADFGGNDNLVYTIIKDNSTPFTIDAASGVVIINGSLDRELILNYTFSVTASDSVGNFDTANVTVTIEDANDNVPTFLQSSYSFRIREDSSVDFIVGPVSAVDRDIGTNANILYTIEDYVPFHIISTSGVIVVSQELDREMEDIYQFVVLANNTEGLEGFDAANVTITIADVNDNTPVFTEQVYEVTVKENFPLFVPVITVTANDSDIGMNAIITYQLLPSSDSTTFYVNETNGEIYLLANIDYEAQSEYTLTVTATDGMRSSQAVINVSVSDENDNTPVFHLPSYSGNVAENTLSLGILTVQATDSDSGVNQQIVYSILTTENNFPFSLNETSGIVFLTRMLDREDNDEYIFSIVAEDRGIPSLNSTATITITVEDRNDNAPIFDEVGYNISQAEGTEDIGTIIFNVTAVDIDAGSNSVVIYSIVAGNERRHFSIDAFTGEITLVTSLDAESTQQHELIIEAADRGTPVQSSAVIVFIDVVNINDNIPVINLNVTSVIFQEGGNAITVAPFIIVEDGDIDHLLLQSNVSLICPCGDDQLILGGVSDTIIVSDRHISINGPIADTTLSEILKTVQYINNDAEPDPEDRMVIFTIYDGIAVVSANVTINIVTVNDQPPVVDLNVTDSNTVNSQITFTEGSSSVLVFGTTINITDEDSNTLDYIDLELSGPLDATANITATPNGLVMVSSFGPTMIRLMGPAPHTDFLNTLASVYYHNIGNNPRKPLQRTVGVIANDGIFNATAMGIIIIEAVNDPPVIQLSDQFNYSTTFLEGGPPVSLVSFLSISDPDSPTLQFASIELIDSVQDNSEYLVVESHENTSIKINETSVLISGPATIDDFITVLSSARYFKNASNSGFGIRTVTFTVNDGALLARAYVDVEVIMLNDPPVISLNMGNNIIEFIESGLPVTFIPTNLTVTDEDSDLIHSAVITLRNVMDGGQENLQLPPHPNLTSTYNPLLGQLVIQGEAMPSVYEEALISVTYSNMAEEPSAVDRQIEVTVSDGLATSDGVMVIVLITLINDSPKIVLNGDDIEFSTLYFENSNPVSVVNMLSAQVIDVDSLFLSHLTVELMGIVDEGMESLIFNSSVTLEINVTSHIQSRIYNITFADQQGSLAMYTELLKSSRYNNSALEPNATTNRTIIFTVSDGQLISPPAVTTITIQLLDDNQPQFFNSEYAAGIEENSTNGTFVAQLNAFDSDVGDTFIYVLESNSVFVISPETGVVTTIGSVDRESVEFYTLAVFLARPGSPLNIFNDQAMLNITILDINDNAPIFSEDIYSTEVAEDVEINSVIFTAIATDADVGVNAEIQYFISTDTDVFMINSTIGDVILTQTLDREIDDTYSIVIVGEDQGQPSMSSQTILQIRVTDINDSPPVFMQASYVFSILETAQFGNVVGQVIATDLDSDFNSILTYSFLEGNINETFNINVSTGVIETANLLNFAITARYDLMVLASDQGFPPLNATVSVVIQVISEDSTLPMFLQPSYQAMVFENVTIDTIVLQVQANDPLTNASDTLVYSFQDTTITTFVIDPMDGTITVNESLDREIQDLYQVEVIAMDIQDPARLGFVQINIDILDSNDFVPVFDQPVYNFRIEEGVASDTVVGMVLARDDRDIGSNSVIIDYFIKEQDIPFAINSSGVVVTELIADRENVSYYEFNIIAIDGGFPMLSGNAIVRITITDINDNAPVFDQSSVMEKVPENASVSYSVVTVSATDVDEGDNGMVEFRLLDGSPFTINRMTGLITLQEMLDYESVSQYNITVVAEDLGNPQLNSIFLLIITVVNLDDTAPVFTMNQYNFSISENASSSSEIGMVTAVDVDSSEILYEIVGGNTQSLFSIDMTGTISVQQSLDRENISEYTLDVVASSSDYTGNTLFSSAFVLVIVTDVNDNAPEFINDPYEFSIPENVTIGTVVGRFTVIDQDDGFNSLIVTMIEGDLFSILGSSVVVSSSLDHETQDSYMLELLAEDAGDPLLRSSTQVFINVTDINDNAPVFSQSVYTVMVADNSTNGTVVFTAMASDADEGINAMISYSFDDITLSAFSIDAVTGEVILSGQLDAEVISSYDIVIIASDGMLLSNITLHIEVGNLDDAPVQFTNAHYVAAIGENSLVGSPVTQVVAEDPDITQSTISYGLVNENLFPFQIDPMSGHITVSGVLDREETPEYIITVTASNVPQFTATAIVIINIFDVSDEPPMFVENSYQFSTLESADVGATIGSVSAIDPDILGFIMSYVLLPSSSPFIIDFFGNIMLTSPLDFEEQDQYSLMAFVSDEIGLNGSVNVLINVTDVNDNSPAFSVNSYTAEINETAPVGTVVISINATDSDSGTNALLCYKLSPDLSPFDIDSSTGVVSVAEDFINLNQSLYLLNVIATDGGEVPLSSSVTLLIRILTANRPPAFIEDPYEASISEDVSVGSMIVEIQAIDQNFNGNVEIVYSLEPNDTFIVNPTTGNITTIESLDREVISSYTLIATAIDLSIVPQLDVKVEVRITITDVNDNAPQFSESMYNASLPENSIIGTFVVMVFATDRDIDANGAISYSVVQENSIGHFGVNTTSGEIYLREEIDFETFTVANLVIRAQDGGQVGMSNVVDVIIDIIDVDDNPPVFEQNQYTEMHSEDLPVNTTIVQVQATDADQLDNAAIQYRLLNDTNLFSINSENGTIILQSPGLDYEIVRSYILIVEAFNPFSSQFTASTRVIIIVIDENDNPPVFQQLFYHFNITENSPTQQLIGSVLAEDNDVSNNGNVTYTIISNFVSIGQLTGELRLAEVVDREMTNILSLEVIAVDQGFPQMTGRAIVNVTVIDINDNAPEINIGTSQFVYVEGSNPINVGGNVIVIDADDTLPLQTCNILLQGGNGFISLDNVPASVSMIATDNFISLTGPVSVALYTTILHSLQFSAANLPEPFGGQRMISITVSDGTFTSTSDVILIDVELINDNEPELDLSLSMAGLGFSTTFIEEGNPVGVVGFDATVRDLDEDGEIIFINITLNGVLDDTLETFVYSEENNISVEVHSNHSISIIGPGTADDFVSTLKEVTYVNYADEPSPGIRNITFTAFDGRFTSAAAISVIRIQLQNDRPIVFLGITQDVLIVYSESNESVSITQSGFSITDRDNTMVTYLTVSIQDFDMTFDSLLHVITDELNLTAEMISGDLQITGAASLMEYTEVLGSIMYTLSDDTNETFEDIQSRIVPRVISVVVSDGITTSIPAVATIVFSAVNNPPLITNTDVVTTFIEEGSPVFIAPFIMVTDVDSTNLTSATAHIENVLDDGMEILEISFSSSQITIIYNETSSTVSLFGMAPVSEYQDLLRNLSYVNTNSEPTEGNRRITITINDGEKSGVATALVNVKQKNDPPGLSVVFLNNTFIEQGEPVALISRVVLLDEDNTTFTRLIVILSGALDGTSEEIIFPKVADVNSTMSYILPATLQYDVFFEPRSLGTVANYIELLEGISYSNAAQEPSVATRNISLVISDGSTQSPPVLVSIDTKLVNDNPPVFVRTTEATFVIENSPSNTVIFTANATDLDEDSEIDYAIDNSSCNSFSINSTSGDVIITGVLDYEIVTQCEITVTATDGTFNTSLILLVNINDENDNPPMFVEDTYGAAILENQPIGTRVLSVSAMDNDEGDNAVIVYSIAANVPFSINHTGCLFTTEELDFENRIFYFFSVQAVDSGLPSLTSTVPVNIMVENVNEMPPIFNDSLHTSISVPETVPVDSTIITISAYDPDGNSSILYSIVDGNYSGIFIIDEITGDLILTRSLNRETEDGYQLVIAAVDSGLLPILTETLQLDITVLDVNDNSPMFTQKKYNSSIPENTAVGTIVVQLIAVDIDIGPNAVIYYNIISGDSSERFGVNSDGGIFVQGELDRERTQVYQLEVTASNSQNGSIVDDIQTDIANVTIIITDINDNRPVFTKMQYRFTAAENVTIATVVGLVNATDADEEGNQLIYEIQSPDNFTVPFNVDNNGLLSVTEMLDYEAIQNYRFVVIATDSGNLSGTATIFIEILNVNDNPPEFFGLDEFGILRVSVVENLPTGSNLTTIVAIDRDSLDDLSFGISYTILGNQELFQIDHFTGIVTLIGELNYENITEHNITISASDSVKGSLISTAILTVLVEDQNEFSPVFTMDGYSVTISENATMLSSIITVTATDFDGGSTSVVEYQLLDSSTFIINSTTGLVQSVALLDREITSFYSLTLRAFNPFGSPPLDSFSILNITVSDVNDNAPMFQEEMYIASIPVGSPAEYLVIQVNATDIDASNILQYSIVNTSVPFSISANGSIFTTGLITELGVYTLLVSATDNGDPQLTAFSIVTINVLRIADFKFDVNGTGFLLSSSSLQQFGFFVNAAPGSEGTLTASLLNISSTESYETVLPVAVRITKAVLLKNVVYIGSRVVTVVGQVADDIGGVRCMPARLLIRVLPDSTLSQVNNMILQVSTTQHTKSI